MIFVFAKRVRHLLVGGNWAKSPSPNLHVHEAVFNIFYTWFQRASQSTTGPGKKPTVIPTCSFIAQNKLEFLHLFSESSPALKDSWLRACKTTEILQRYMKFFRDIYFFHMLKIKTWGTCCIQTEPANKVWIFFVVLYGLGVILWGTAISQERNWNIRQFPW